MSKQKDFAFHIGETMSFDVVIEDYNGTPLAIGVSDTISLKVVNLNVDPPVVVGDFGLSTGITKSADETGVIMIDILSAQQSAMRTALAASNLTSKHGKYVVFRYEIRASIGGAPTVQLVGDWRVDTSLFELS